MTGLNDEAFWRWVRDNPPETIEALVLQHVKISPREGKRGSVAYVVSTPDGAEVTTIHVSAKEARSKSFDAAKAITVALVKHIMCSKCGQRLIEGETIVCSTCEATQAMDLLRLVRELQGGLMAEVRVACHEVVRHTHIGKHQTLSVLVKELTCSIVTDLDRGCIDIVDRVRQAHAFPPPQVGP